MAKSAKKPTSKKPTFTKSNPKPAVRKVAAPASAKAQLTVAAKATGGGVAPMTTYGVHTYLVSKTPVTCTDWAVGNYVDIYVSEPPPAKLTFADGDDCDGTEVTLIS